MIAHQATVRDKASILIVDDTPENLHLLTALLGPAGYIVRPNLNGRFALQYWKFSVSDNGPGIDVRHHERIFQIFQTLSTDNGNGSTGVGLSIMKKIVEGHEGKIGVESTVGQGSTFWFTVPKGAQSSSRAFESSSYCACRSDAGGFV